MQSCVLLDSGLRKSGRRSRSALSPAQAVETRRPKPREIWGLELQRRHCEHASTGSFNIHLIQIGGVDSSREMVVRRPAAALKLRIAAASVKDGRDEWTFSPKRRVHAVQGEALLPLWIEVGMLFYNRCECEVVFQAGFR